MPNNNSNSNSNTPRRLRARRAAAAPAPAHEQEEDAAVQQHQAGRQRDNCRPSRAQGQWWRRLRDEDPITLQPLRSLPSEPFNLPSDAEAGKAECWFDAVTLRQYLISSLSFVHPLSRRVISVAECEALDAHIALRTSARTKGPSVAHVLANKEDALHQQAIRDAQQDAQAILDALFQSSSPSPSSSSRSPSAPSSSSSSAPSPDDHPAATAAAGSLPPATPATAAVHFPALGQRAAQRRSRGVAQGKWQGRAWQGSSSMQGQQAWPGLPSSSPSPSSPHRQGWAQSSGAVAGGGGGGVRRRLEGFGVGLHVHARNSRVSHA